ncbi:MAG: class I SAM-dependent methyltransferase [Mycobacterium sp.]|nr:class I SAM-dependent methyltransferase [Mycobacterium sp.]
MSDHDRVRWDRRYTEREAVSDDEVGLPAVFQPFADTLPTAGRALDLACGRGGAAVWLARRGLQVRGYDVSPVAIAQARALADRVDVSARCQFDVADLDAGLPAGPPVDMVLCNRFRDARLDRPIIERLSLGGLLAISVLSEVGASPGPFRVGRGELRQAFGGLDVIAEHEADGEAWLVARRLRQ